MDKLTWAMENYPTPLTEEIAHRFTWEGANDRLFKAAGITKREERERIDSGQEKADYEVENTKKGQFLHNFFTQPVTEKTAPE
jgi:hypothetical protein